MVAARRRDSDSCLQRGHPLVNRLNHLFERYGNVIAYHPWWFLIVPIIVGLAFSPGVMQLKRISNTDTTIWTTSASRQRAINDPKTRKWFGSLDKMCTCQPGANCSSLPAACKASENPNDLLGCDHLQVMLFSRNKNSMTDPTVVVELMKLDAMILLTFNVTRPESDPILYSTSNNESADYQVCQRRKDGSCIHFSVITGFRQVVAKLPGLSKPQAQDAFLLDLLTPSKKEEFEGLVKQGASKFYYPYDASGQFIALIYGGVSYMKANESWKYGFKTAQAKSIKAMQMYYCLNNSNPSASKEWTRKVSQKIKSAFRNNKFFSVVVGSSWGPGEKTNQAILDFATVFLVTVIAGLAFVFVTSYIYGGALTAKPWFNFFGFLLQLLAICATFGFMGWVEIGILDFSVTIAILMLVLGIGDVLSISFEWAYSSNRSYIDVAKRMGTIMRKTSYCIVSVALMNITAFAIDMAVVDSAAIKAYSTVATIGLTFQLIINLTALPACLALFARRQAMLNHSCCCCSHVSNAYSYMGPCRLMCCAEDTSVEIYSNGSTDNKEIWHTSKGYRSNRMMKRGGPNYANIITRSTVFRRFPSLVRSKITVFVVLGTYLLYVAACGYLFTQIEVGLLPEHLAPEDPEGPNEIAAYVKNFREFSYTIDIYITGDNVEYWDPQTRASILRDLMSNVHQVVNIAPKVMDRNWLADFVNYTTTRKIDISSQENFFGNLTGVYFRDPKIDKAYLGDVAFNDDKTLITASRYSVWAVNCIDLSSSIKVIAGLRDVAAKYANGDLKVRFVAPDFDLVEPMMEITTTTVQCVLVHFGIILIFSIILWLHPISVFLLVFAAASSTLGIIALSLAWSIQLDPISLFGIISSMGFAVNFPTKLINELTVSFSNPKRRGYLGNLAKIAFGVVQSSVASLIAILAMSTCTIYLVSAEFKFVFVTLCIGCYHVIFVMPVMAFYLTQAKMQPR